MKTQNKMGVWASKQIYPKFYSQRWGINVNIVHVRVCVCVCTRTHAHTIQLFQSEHFTSHQVSNNTEANKARADPTAQWSQRTLLQDAQRGHRTLAAGWEVAS